MYVIFFFNNSPPTEIYTYSHTLSLHDALPIYSVQVVSSKARHRRPEKKANMSVSGAGAQAIRMATGLILACRRYKCFGCQAPFGSRSEEHTSELQSLMRISYAVFCLKKKTTHY